MTITWYGQTCFRMIIPKGKDGQVNILIDPLQKESGLRSPRLEADILLSTDSENQKVVSGNYFLITGPGEYDVKGVYIEGISALNPVRDSRSEKETQSKHISNGVKNTIYTIEAEGMKICHLGKLSQEELASNQLEKIGEVDILMVPIGGGEAIDAKGAVKIMAQIEPKIIIPMYYRVPKLKLKLDGPDNFLKALEIKTLEPLLKLSIKKKDISKEEVKIIVLKP